MMNHTAQPDDPFDQRSERDRVGITGVGVVSPFGVGVSLLIEAFADGRTAATPRSIDAPPSGSSSSPPVVGPYLVCPVPDFSTLEHLGPVRRPYPSRYRQLALIASSLAFADSGLEDAEGRDRIGTIVTTEFGPNSAVEKFLDSLYVRGAEFASPLTFASTVMNVSVGDIARRLRVTGPSSLILGENSACYAFDLLRADKASAILCGGVDELRNPHIWAYHCSDVAVSAQVSKAPEPYSEYVGVLLGEGAAFVVLERLDHARARRADVYAEVLGYASVRDDKNDHLLTTRTPRAFAEAMSAALGRREAPDSVDLFVLGAANTAAAVGAAERDACREVRDVSSVPLANIKGYVGETFGASAAMNLVTAALVLRGDLKLRGGNQVVGLAEGYGSCLSNSIHIGGNDTTMVLQTVRGGMT